MYKLLDNSVLRLTDNTRIPFADGNKEYEEYKLWLAEGNEPEPFESEADKLKKDLDAQFAAIDAERDTALNRGVNWNGDFWHTDTDFAVHLNSFASAFSLGMLPADAKVYIRTNDNQIRQLGFEEIKTLALAVMGYVQTAYGTSWAKKDALEAKYKAAIAS